MATNNNGHLLDTDGNVAVDFVWGNFPLQPNDVRPDTATGRLDFALDNHVIAQVGWNGYPLYTPNTDGSAVDSDSPADGIQADEIFLNVPTVVGLTTALAVDALKDAGFATVTTASGATNAAKDITRFNATSATVAVVYTTSASTAYPVGTKLAIAAGTPAGSNPVAVPAYAIGTWTVTAAASGNVTIVGSGFTIADTTGINATGSLTGVAGTIKSVAYASGTAANQTTASTVTVTPFAVAS